MDITSDNSFMKVSQTGARKRSSLSEQNNLPYKKRRKALHQHETTSQIRKDLLQRFQQFNVAQSLSRILGSFKKILGRHLVINYDSNKHNFKEQWQVTNKYEDKQQYKTNFIYGCIKFIILIIMNCCTFAVSVKLAFQIENSQWIYFVVALLCLLKIIENIPHILSIPKKQKVKVISKEVVCILCSVFLAAFEYKVGWFSIIGLVIIILLYINSCELYQHLKIFHLSSKYRQIVDIIDLFVLLLTVSHIFALLLYGTTLLHPNSNWMSRLNLQNYYWSTKYIYSLYFSCTTLLTVGYGDIAPTNVTQILTILLAELIGVATFAYAVNQIGAVLCNITESAQKMQKDLGNVEQIGNQYHLKPELICRMRTQLTKNKALDSQINTKQENQLFSKFSQDLRQQIQLESSMRVIKRSMFMIGNWTGKLQAKVARRLIKQIYAVDQCLPQHQGKQKIYMLDKGKIQIISNTRMGFKVCFQKVLKVLHAKSDNQVLLQNVYGYSAVISNRQIHLNAIAKSNVICYSVSKQVIYELLAESNEDLQHFHEIKSKIDLCKIPEQVEAPSIINFYQHYCPSVHYIIAQNNNKQFMKNARIPVIRNRRKMAMKCYNQTLSSRLLLSRRQRARKSRTADEIFSQARVSQADEQKYRSQNYNKQWQMLSGINIDSQFESCKQFQRYFKKSNYQNVINKLKIRMYKEIARQKKNQQHTFKMRKQFSQNI